MSKKTIDELHSVIQDGNVVARQKPEKPYVKCLDPHAVVCALADGCWVDAETLCKALRMTFSQVKDVFEVRVKPESKDLLHPGLPDHMIRLKPRRND